MDPEWAFQARDLIPFIGSHNRVHEVFNRRRSLTLTMIRRLHEGLGIPAESLIKGERKRAAQRIYQRGSGGNLASHSLPHQIALVVSFP
jgi:hypothetical protein